MINDKVGHFLTFFVLGCWGAYGWSSQPVRKWVFGFLFGFGLAIECVQYFVPLRHFSLADWGADIAGLLFSVLFCRFFRRRSMNDDK